MNVWIGYLEVAWSRIEPGHRLRFVLGASRLMECLTVVPDVNFETLRF